MTNKINGIDVSECEHFWNKHEALKLELCRINFANNYFSNGITVAEKCNKHPNCYFKQLKRLQQELDIKEKMLDKFMIGSGETLEKLQKENEELKAENEQLKKPCLVMPKVNQLAVPIEKYEKLHKALEEIRKIVSGNYEILDPQAKQDIKKLINEVLEDSED